MYTLSENKWRNTKDFANLVCGSLHHTAPNYIARAVGKEVEVGGRVLQASICANSRQDTERAGYHPTEINPRTNLTATLTSTVAIASYPLHYTFHCTLNPGGRARNVCSNTGSRNGTMTFT